MGESAETIDAGGPVARPTRTRYVLLVWLCGLAAILYLDRICMSQAVEPIQKEFGLTGRQISGVLMAFTLAYGLFEVPTGRLGDRFGSRTVLTRIVVCWSAFTALTGASTGFVTLLVIRFLFGAGEAGAYPNVARVIARWFPVDERGRVQGLFLTASQLGAVAAPAASAYLIELVGWRGAFACFGLVGVAWAVGFWRWFRDDPAAHPGVDAAELATIRAGGGGAAGAHGPLPWRAVLTNPTVWVLTTCMSCAAFNAYFFYSWFPTYLMAARGVENTHAGWLSSLVLAGPVAGILAGGWVADRITRRAKSVVWARRLFGAAAFGTAAALLFAAVRCESPLALAVLMSLSCLTYHLTMPTWWSSAIELGGRHVGAVFGLMNGLGAVGALGSLWLVGAVSDAMGRRGFTGRERWDPVFDVYLVVLLVGAVAWALYRSRPLPDEVGGERPA